MEAEILANDKANTASRWYVLYVKPRCEKKMAGYCGAHGVKFELPLREETKIYQRRKVTVLKPVFPGYIFLRFVPADTLIVLKSNLVVRILPIENQAQFVRELQQILQALAIDPTLDASSAFQTGRRVLIKSGPFQGVEGIVQVVKGRARVVLNVDIIGRALAVEVGIELLEPAE